MRARTGARPFPRGPDRPCARCFPDNSLKPMGQSSRSPMRATGREATRPACSLTSLGDGEAPDVHPSPAARASRFIARHTSRGCIVVRLSTGMSAARASRLARPVPPVVGPLSVQQRTAGGAHATGRREQARPLLRLPGATRAEEAVPALPVQVHPARRLYAPGVSPVPQVRERRMRRPAPGRTVVVACVGPTMRMFPAARSRRMPRRRWSGRRSVHNRAAAVIRGPADGWQAAQVTGASAREADAGLRSRSALVTEGRFPTFRVGEDCMRVESCVRESQACAGH